MKSLVLAAALSILATPLADAQLLRTEWGLRAGGAAATIRGTDVAFESRQSLVGGLYYRIAPRTPFSLQAEALVLNKGATFDQRLPGGQRVRGDYAALTLELPLLARARLAPVGQLDPVLFLGPYVSVTLTQSMEEVGFPVQRDISFRTFDSGFVFGTGVDLRLVGTTLQFDIRYTLGSPGVLRTDGRSEGNHGVLVFATGLSLPGS
jgi:hypothetical protein